MEERRVKSAFQSGKRRLSPSQTSAAKLIKMSKNVVVRRGPAGGGQRVFSTAVRRENVAPSGGNGGQPQAIGSAKKQNQKARAASKRVVSSPGQDETLSDEGEGEGRARNMTDAEVQTMLDLIFENYDLLFGELGPPGSETDATGRQNCWKEITEAVNA